MNPHSLPDIAGMLILMAVLDWLRRKYRDASVDLWMLGLTFILLEALAVAVFRGPAQWLSNAAHALALDSYVLAAATFGLAAREDLPAGRSRLPLIVPPAIPLFALATIYGFSIGFATEYIAIAAGSLVSGIAYIVFFVRADGRFLALLLTIHLVLWGPMTCMAIRGN